MPALRDSAGRLTLGGVPLVDLARDADIGTPTYVYDLDAIADEAHTLEAAFGGTAHLVAYAVKANTAGPIVRTVAGEGCGADVVSGAELAVAVGCGVSPERIVYSGVAKTDAELDRAIACGGRGIGAVQLESVEEIARVAARARSAGRRARIALRINPSVDIEMLDTHAHIATGHDEAKFGIPTADVSGALDRVAESPELELVGMGTHIGSQLTSIDGYVEAARVLFGMVRDVRGAGRARSLAFVDTGGGFGIDYGEGCAVRPTDFVRAAREAQRAAGIDDLALYVEPGRSLVAAHGVLVATVIQSKVAATRRWMMIDAGMNDLMRPALYQARHRIVPVEGGYVDATRALEWRVVGPVCESSDDFGTHTLPREPPREVAILDAGAYGYTMASRYNGRPLPAEVFVRGGRVVGKTRRAAPEEWVEDRVRAGY
jgi:diaminopimelate decarboxylase